MAVEAGLTDPDPYYIEPPTVPEGQTLADWRNWGHCAAAGHDWKRRYYHPRGADRCRRCGRRRDGRR